MKSAIISAIVLIVAACGGESTSNTLEIEEVNASSDVFQYPTLPVLEMPKIAIAHGPAFASVQPRTILTFSFSSCAERDFEVETQTVTSFGGKKTFVQVNEQLTVDCFGPHTLRDYSLQISSDSMADGAYVIVNPTLIDANNR